MRFINDIARFHLIHIVVFGSMFLGVLYFTSYDDGSGVKKSIEDVQTQTNQASLQVEKKKKELQDAKAFKNEVLKEEKVLKSFLSFIPSSLTFTDISTLLIQEAKHAGVNIQLKQDQQIKKEENSEYHALDVQLKINGSFTQILLFLSKLTAQKRMLIVHNIDMKANKKNQLIEVQLNISAYRYVKKKEEEKKTDTKKVS